MSKSGSYGGKSKPISKREKHTEMNSTLLGILFNIQLKLVIDNIRYIILLTFRCKQVWGENRKPICLIHIQTPICNRNHSIDYDYISHKNIDNGKEWWDKRTEQEWSNSSPVQCDCSESQTSQTWTELLSCDWFGEDPTDPWDAC